MPRSPRALWASLLLVGIVSQLPAQEPRPHRLATSSPSITLNQQVAETIAARLRQSGLLKNYRVDVQYENGVANLSGTVSSEPQREEVLRLVQSVTSVERVVDHLQVRSARTIKQAQGQLPPVPKTYEGPAPTPTKDGGVGSDFQAPEPQPIFRAPVPVSSTLAPPRMPPYAWPTYAPYNNFSRVAYPQAYPKKAWPFIGPFYPFPKVPLGWRSIKLEWDDGYWWYSRTATKYGWWRLRFW